MKNHVTLIDQLGSDGMIVDSVDRVMKTRVTFEVLNVFDRPGGKIVDHVNFIATLEVESDESSTEDLVLDSLPTPPPRATVHIPVLFVAAIRFAAPARSPERRWTRHALLLETIA